MAKKDDQARGAPPRRASLERPPPTAARPCSCDAWALDPGPHAHPSHAGPYTCPLPWAAPLAASLLLSCRLVAVQAERLRVELEAMQGKAAKQSKAAEEAKKKQAKHRETQEKARAKCKELQHDRDAQADERKKLWRQEQDET